MDSQEGDFAEKRRTRTHSGVADDQRAPFQRDRDRILYCSAFQRLSGITQIVRVGEADVFHTRQQHTLKVAQVGRRLAEMLVAQNRGICAKIGVDPDVVEAACLAHDLGHPPFGHIAEKELDELVQEGGDNDGYEGNAQSFRIVTTLAVRLEKKPGLDLTWATLGAILKYPWLRDDSDVKKSKKWGAYKTEGQELINALSMQPSGQRSPEAELMDWADDIAYSVHDLEEFHRCGAIPWFKIFPFEGGSASDSENLIRDAARRHGVIDPQESERMKGALERLKEVLHLLNFSDPYVGTREQRYELRATTSSLIKRYIQGTKISDEYKDGGYLQIDSKLRDEIYILKEIVHRYVITSPSLISQQWGQRRIISELFRDLYDASKRHMPGFLPHRLRYLWDLRGNSRARFAADCIASLTESETVKLHSRLRGTSSGSVLDPIVR